MKEMKKFVSIGHWEGNKNTTWVGSLAYTMKDFRNDLLCNGFTPYVIISEKKMEVLKQAHFTEVFDEVRKMTSSRYYWSIVTDYINECVEGMDEIKEFFND